LELCCTMMVDKKHHSNAGTAVRKRVLPQALVLVKSSLLQGQALQVAWHTFLNVQYSG
jgi:cullin-associated NEDD8-dissociated protein 1